MNRRRWRGGAGRYILCRRAGPILWSQALLRHPESSGVRHPLWRHCGRGRGSGEWRLQGPRSPIRGRWRFGLHCGGGGPAARASAGHRCGGCSSGDRQRTFGWPVRERGCGQRLCLQCSRRLWMGGGEWMEIRSKRMVVVVVKVLLD